MIQEVGKWASERWALRRSKAMGARLRSRAKVYLERAHQQPTEFLHSTQFALCHKGGRNALHPSSSKTPTDPLNPFAIASRCSLPSPDPRW